MLLAREVKYKVLGMRIPCDLFSKLDSRISVKKLFCIWNNFKILQIFGIKSLIQNFFLSISTTILKINLFCLCVLIFVIFVVDRQKTTKNRTLRIDFLYNRTLIIFLKLKIDTHKYVQTESAKLMWLH